VILWYIHVYCWFWLCRDGVTTLSLSLLLHERISSVVKQRTNFHIFFADILSGKFAIEPHLKHVATLPCEISLSENSVFWALWRYIAERWTRQSRDVWQFYVIAAETAEEIPQQSPQQNADDDPQYNAVILVSRCITGNLFFWLDPKPIVLIPLRLHVALDLLQRIQSINQSVNQLINTLGVFENLNCLTLLHSARKHWTHSLMPPVPLTRLQHTVLRH